MALSITRLRARHIAAAWAAVLCLQVATGVLWRARHPMPRESSPLLTIPDSTKARPLSPAGQDSVLAFLFVMLRDHSPSRPQALDSLARQSNGLSLQSHDSLWRAWRVPARLTAAQRDSLRAMGDTLLATVLGPVVTALGEGFKGLNAFFAVVFALLLGPHVAMFGFSWWWWAIQRRERRVGRVAA